MFTSTAAIFLLASTLSSAAMGSTKDEAEARRLTTEMNSLAARNAWGGVSRAYDSLLALGTPVDMDTHLLAIQAAKSEGDVVASWNRVKTVLRIDPMNTDLITQMAELEANYGPVNIRVARGFQGDPALTGQDLGFNPEYTAVIAHAKGDIIHNREYIGPLPLGRYQLASAHFEVIGGPEVELLLKPERREK